MYGRRLIKSLLLVFFCFMVVLFISYDHKSGSLVTVTRSTHSSIEDTLRRIPVCTINDRARQRALLHLLQAWTHFAHQHHIQYWIAYNSLAGFVRHQGLSPYDQSIDILIMAHDTAELLHLSHVAFSSRYELLVQPQWFIVNDTKRSYFLLEGINFVARNARFISTNDHLEIDIWPSYDYHPNQKRMFKNTTAMLTQYGDTYDWKSYPRQWTFPLKECVFSGMNVWCPAEPERLVTNIYEKMSVNMSAKVCVNGSWVKSNR